MPAWKGFLTDDKIHLLTAYVWGKSHPDYKGYPQDTKDYVGGIPTAEEPKKAAEPAASAPVVAVSAPAVAASEPTPVVAASEVQAAPAADKAEVRVENGVVKFYFAVGKSAIAANAEKATEEVVKAAKAGKKLVISGFTDSTGNAVANEKLSKNRAQAVQAYLIKQGVKKDSMVLRKPESSVGAKGNNAEGRRVEVKIQD